MQKLRICSGLVFAGCGALASGIAGTVVFKSLVSGRRLFARPYVLP